MTQRERQWAYFARLLPREIQAERRVLEWLRDEEIDRVIAYLETWRDSERDELDQYRANLGETARFFRPDGEWSRFGEDRYYDLSTYEQERLDEIQDQLRWRSGRIRYLTTLVRYANARVSGSDDIAEADRLYEELTSSSFERKL